MTIDERLSPPQEPDWAWGPIAVALGEALPGFEPLPRPDAAVLIGRVELDAPGHDDLLRWRRQTPVRSELQTAEGDPVDVGDPEAA